MKNGRPRTGRKGKPVNIYLPPALVEAAKKRFHAERGMSLSEGVRTLLTKEVEGKRKTAA